MDAAIQRDDASSLEQAVLVNGASAISVRHFAKASANCAAVLARELRRTIDAADRQRLSDSLKQRRLPASRQSLRLRSSRKPHPCAPRDDPGKSSALRVLETSARYLSLRKDRHSIDKLAALVRVGGYRPGRSCPPHVIRAVIESLL